jgi:hypothetical protein
LRLSWREGSRHDRSRTPLGPGETGAWSLDGRLLGHGTRRVRVPWPGSHVLQLRLADGRITQCRFEVRGAWVGPARTASH